MDLTVQHCYPATSMIDTLASVVAILTFAVMVIKSAWKYREKLADWCYVARYQLTNPFRKDSFNESATITAHVAGRFRSIRNPYSGEWETSYISFKIGGE